MTYSWPLDSNWLSKFSPSGDLTRLEHDDKTDTYSARLYYVPLEYWRERGIVWPAAQPIQLYLPFSDAD